MSTLISTYSAKPFRKNGVTQLIEHTVGVITGPISEPNPTHLLFCSVVVPERHRPNRHQFHT